MRIAAAFAASCLLLAACAGGGSPRKPAIEFTRVPAADKGGPDTIDVIEGRVTGALPGQRIVLFSKGAVWWVQPAAKQPFTTIGADSTWKSTTHLGTEYAALLVGPEYHPPASTETLATEGAGIAAFAVVPGDPSRQPPHHTVQFSGYEWLVRNAPSDRGGTNDYDPANVWTDDGGALHLRIAGADPGWTCAEVSLTRRLGYGSYRFVVRDVGHLEPAAVLTFFTWEGAAADQNHREMDIEISRWGDPTSLNAQYVVQPYYVTANVARFDLPAGLHTHTLRWEPGRLTATTRRGALPEKAGPVVSTHTFTSGVPSPGNERVRMNLYVFRRSVTPLARGTEVVIEKFEYIP